MANDEAVAPLEAPTPPSADGFDDWLAGQPEVGGPPHTYRVNEDVPTRRNGPYEEIEIEVPECLRPNFVSLLPPTPLNSADDEVEWLLWDWVCYLNQKYLHPAWEPYVYDKLKAAMWSQGRLGFPYYGSCRVADIERLCSEVMRK